MKQSKFPKGWDEEKVHRVLAHYEKQTDEEALAEDEAAYEDRTQTTIDIPIELVRPLQFVLVNLMKPQINTDKHR